MASLDTAYEPHLAMMELFIAPGEEWTPRSSGWSLIQIGSGTGYWLYPQLNQELAAGAVLLVGKHVEGTIRASQLGGARVRFFRVEPERLTGLVTLSEQRFFETAAGRKDLALRIHSPESPIAVKLSELCANRDGKALSFRLNLIQLFFEAFGNEPRQGFPQEEAQSGANERLRQLLERTQVSELLDMRFSELAQKMLCTPRHLNRIFHEVVGASFRDKQTEVRLSRARELLATTESKVLDVALESGYQSVSLFNLMFKKRHGLTPGQWREKMNPGKTRAPQLRLLRA